LGRKRIGMGLFLMVALFLLLSGESEAIPAFSKKYVVPCTTCHSNWTRLNKTGYQFALNGFQLPDGRDGSKASKVSPAWNVHLDTGGANPPIGLRLRGGMRLSEPKSDSGGEQANNYFCCTDENRLSLQSAGTVKEDFGYYIAYNLSPSNGGMDQGFLRFANVWGIGKLGIDMGVLRTTSFDAVPKNREWFGSKNAAYFGNDSFRGRDQGVSLGYSDTGIRIYGNPNMGIFSYDFLYVTGGRTTDSRNRGRGKGTGAMGRVDTENLSLSLRYWESKSSALTFNTFGTEVVYSLDGASGTGTHFSPDVNDDDEKTTDLILDIQYRTYRTNFNFIFDQNNFSVGSRTNGVSSYSRTDVKRSGASLSAIYRFSSTMAFGARYSQSTMSDFSQTLNGTTRSTASSKVSKVDFQLELIPAQNARLSLGIYVDLSDVNARERADTATGSVSQYEQQNKFVLTWDWAI